MAHVHLGDIVPIVTAVPVFGYTVPPLALVVLIVNVLMVMTLLRRHMRSPINSLLIGIATMDTVAIVMPVPVFIYFYSTGNFYHFVPYSWCRAYFTMVYVLPLMCNMASLWITVALACVRCFSVWCPLVARSKLTSYRTNLGLVTVIFVSVVVYFPSLFEYNFIPIEQKSATQGNATSLVCKVEKSFSHLSETFCEAHTWVQILLTSLLPWFSMPFPSLGMLWRLKRAELKRDSLLNGNDFATDYNKQDKRKLGEKMQTINQHMELTRQRRMITWMIFFSVTIIWLVEIPFAVVFTQFLLRSNFDFMRNDIGTAGVVVLMIKYVTYPMIFPMYCIMSQRFRQTFKDVVLCRSTTAEKLYVVTKSNSTQSTDRSLKYSRNPTKKVSYNSLVKDRKMSL